MLGEISVSIKTTFCELLGFCDDENKCSDISVLRFLRMTIFVEAGVCCCYKNAVSKTGACFYRVLAHREIFFLVADTFRVDSRWYLFIHIYCSWFLGWLPYIVGRHPNTNLHIR